MSDRTWQIVVGGAPEAMGLAECAARFMQELGSLCARCEPFSVRLVAEPGFQRPEGSLPLWLEPDLDYSERVVLVDPAEFDSGLPTTAALLHELAHLFLAAMLAPRRQVPWLAEAVCDYLPASFTCDPVILLVSERYTALAPLTRP